MQPDQPQHSSTIAQDTLEPSAQPHSPYTPPHADSQAAPGQTPPAGAGKKAIHWAVWILVGAVLIGGSALAYTAIKKTPEKVSAPRTAMTPSKSSTKAQKVPSTNLSELLNGAKAALGSGAIVQEQAAPDYMVPGYDFYAIGRQEDSSSLKIDRPAAQVPPTITQLETYLVSKGFKKSSQQVKEPYYPLVKYQSTDALCGIRYSDNSGETLIPLYMSCALLASYEPTAQLQKPFYAAYRSSATHTMTDDNRLGYPKIAESKTAGYKTAEVGLLAEAQFGGAAGLFYQTPDGMWHFFKGTQQIIPCGDYNTPDLKKAFLGSQCNVLKGTEDTLSTVTL